MHYHTFNKVVICKDSGFAWTFNTVRALLGLLAGDDGVTGGAKHWGHTPSP